jgi:hypothetical protein
MSNALEVSGKNDGLVFREQTDPATRRSASPADLVRSGCTIKHPVIADGTLEALRWLALVLMTGDHANKYLFNGTLPWLFNAALVTRATSSPFTRTFFQEISMQITIGAHTSAWILAALCSGCASVTVTDNTLEQRTANATGMAVGSFTITDRVDDGLTTRYLAKGKSGQTFNCYVTGTVSFLGRQVSDAQCNSPGRNEGGAADNALLREYNKKAR